MIRHQSDLPAFALASLFSALSQGWARYVGALRARIDATPMPRHHRLGSWQLMLVPLRAQPGGILPPADRRETAIRPRARIARGRTT